MAGFELSKKNGEDRGLLTYTCPWCLRDSSSLTKPVYADPQGPESFHWLLCGHGQCVKPALLRVQGRYAWASVDSNDKVNFETYPPPLPTYELEGVPENVARDFTEALQCHASGFLFGGALVGRRVLEATVVHKGGKGNNLQIKIDSLDVGVLSEPYKRQAHQVRLIGNDAAHADEVSKDDVVDLIVFVDQVLDQLYVNPERLRAAGARREEQKAQQTKKE